MINLNYLQQSQLIYNQTNFSFYNTSIKKFKNMSKDKKTNWLVKIFEKGFFF